MLYQARCLGTMQSQNHDISWHIMTYHAIHKIISIADQGDDFKRTERLLFQSQTTGAMLLFTGDEAWTCRIMSHHHLLLRRQRLSITKLQRRMWWHVMTCEPVVSFCGLCTNPEADGVSWAIGLFGSSFTKVNCSKHFETWCLNVFD